MLLILARASARFSGSLPVPYTPLLDVSHHLLIRGGVTPLNFVLSPALLPSQPPAECPLSLPGGWEEEGKTREEEEKTRRKEIGYIGATLLQVGDILGNG